MKLVELVSYKGKMQWGSYLTLYIKSIPGKFEKVRLKNFGSKQLDTKTKSTNHRKRLIYSVTLKLQKSFPQKTP